MSSKVASGAEESPSQSQVRGVSGLGFRVGGVREIGITWTPKACKIMAFMAFIMGLGPLFYILLGFR